MAKKTVLLIGNANEIELHKAILMSKPNTVEIQFTAIEEVNKVIEAAKGKIAVITGVEDGDLRFQLAGKVIVIHCWSFEFGRDLVCAPDEYQLGRFDTDVEELIETALKGRFYRPKPAPRLVGTFEDGEDVLAVEENDEPEEETPVSAPVEIEEDADEIEEITPVSAPVSDSEDDDDQDDDDDYFVPVIVTGGSGDFGFGAPYEFF
ncbi:hypothetical protein [Edwardsiella tarda]|uniref:Uncharacterized protein n=1 Tax=Edwardsiella tarda TaxID=636 RepID=A0A2A7U7P5_EDWTA|nr:hypothetical protein [Edwardsiella tarda]PEH74281.1 hypothetical protein CRM76_01165 [Edwardsiella tarda]